METSYPCSIIGTTTMKMISSTSTTSTSGVMLISDCRPGSDPPPFICMTSLSPRRRLFAGSFGDQSNTLEAGILDCDHRSPDLSDTEPRIGLDHDLGVLLCTHRCAKAVAEQLGYDFPIVNPQSAF